MNQAKETNLSLIIPDWWTREVTGVTRHVSLSCSQLFEVFIFFVCFAVLSISSIIQTNDWPVVWLPWQREGSVWRRSGISSCPDSVLADTNCLGQCFFLFTSNHKHNHPHTQTDHILHGAAAERKPDGAFKDTLLCPHQFGLNRNCCWLISPSFFNVIRQLLLSDQQSRIWIWVQHGLIIGKYDP